MSPKIVTKDREKYFFRFTLHQRIQHIILFSSVILLSLTGFPLKYSSSWWAPPLYNFFGGIPIATMIHRITGLVIIALFLYHTSTLIYSYAIRLKFLMNRRRLTLINSVKAFLTMEMIPNKRDVKDFFEHMLYLLYLRDQKPRYERMSWKEKFDYFAPYWGLPIVGTAGLILWFREEVSQFLPGIVYNAAYIMHTDEVLLAVLYLSFIHWYNVHYAPEKFPMATVFLSGHLSEEEMTVEHYGEYERVMKEEGKRGEIKPQPKDLKGERLVERIGYNIYTFVMLGLVVWQVAFATRLIFYSHGDVIEETNIQKVSFIDSEGKSYKKIGLNNQFHSMDFQTETDSLGTCVKCHGELPHDKTAEEIKPFLNMHSYYISCEVCHIKTSGDGTGFKWSSKKTGALIPVLPTALLSKKEKGGDYGFKIISGKEEKQGFVPLKGDIVIKAPSLPKLENRNHRNVDKQPLVCTDCHTSDTSYIPLEPLGYSKERIEKLTNKGLLDIIEGYKKFYTEEK